VKIPVGGVFAFLNPDPSHLLVFTFKKRGSLSVNQINNS